METLMSPPRCFEISFIRKKFRKFIKINREIFSLKIYKFVKNIILLDQEELQHTFCSYTNPNVPPRCFTLALFGNFWNICGILRWFL